jgi:hypothetical protein
MQSGRNGNPNLDGVLTNTIYNDMRKNPYDKEARIEVIICS